MNNPEQYVKDILLQRTERDKQISIGASNMSNACTRCLADDMVGATREQGIYNMGAIVGTAIHAYLEERNLDKFALQERKVLIGTIEGYGEVSSTTDLLRIDPRDKTVQICDFKTTSRPKLANYQKAASQDAEFDSESVAHARWTLNQYFRQAQLYGLGVENTLGLVPESVAIIFIARDGQIVDRDVWAPEPIEYSREAALRIFGRAEKLWEWLQDPENDIDALKSSPECYYCSQIRDFVTPVTEL